MRMLRVENKGPDHFAQTAAKDGCVYIISDGSALKIGHSHKPFERLAALQVANSSTLKFVALIAGVQEIEANLHTQFSEYHIRGEWFHDNGDIIECRVCMVAADRAEAA